MIGGSSGTTQIHLVPQTVQDISHGRPGAGNIIQNCRGSPASHSSLGQYGTALVTGESSLIHGLHHGWNEPGGEWRHRPCLRSLILGDQLEFAEDHYVSYYKNQ